MKTRLSQARLLAVVGAISFVVGAGAQEPISSEEKPATNAVALTAATPIVTPAPTPPVQSVNAAAPAVVPVQVKMPYGVEDVVKLTRAQVGEEVVLTFIQNSGTIYNLGADDVVALRNEGVSDKVINNMLDQRKRVTETTSQTAAQAPAQQYEQTPAPAAPTYFQAVYSQPAPVYVQPAPEPAPSTLYVIPYPAATRAYYAQPGYYNSYPYYSPYYVGGYGYGNGYGYGYGCGSPVITINSGFAHRAYRPRWH